MKRLPLVAALLLTALVATSTAPARAADVARLRDLPLSPAADRVDRGRPVFTRQSTKIDNPLFPISDLHSVVLLGNVDGASFRTETTLLPGTRIVVLNGKKVRALVSQYVAFLGGRIKEVATDVYTQADDGAVWYLGEDVTDYRDGVVDTHEGTWHAGKKFPAAMIMPAQPKVGDVFRPENAFPIVFEEVTVKSIDQTVPGPASDVTGAIVTSELHMDATRENKVFAPGYGEFSTGAGGDLEAVALAVPKDALATAMPTSLATLYTAAVEVFDAAGAGDWGGADAALGDADGAWRSLRAATDVPPLLAAQLDRTLAILAGDALEPAVRARNGAGAQRGALDVAMAALDVQLRNRPVTDVDKARFALWTKQMRVDLAAGEAGHVAGDVVSLRVIRDRFVHTLDAADARALNRAITNLRKAAAEEDLAAVGRRLPALERAIARF